MVSAAVFAKRFGTKSVTIMEGGGDDKNDGPDNIHTDEVTAGAKETDNNNDGSDSGINSAAASPPCDDNAQLLTAGETADGAGSVTPITAAAVAAANATAATTTSTATATLLNQFSAIEDKQHQQEEEQSPANDEAPACATTAPGATGEESVPPAAGKDAAEVEIRRDETPPDDAAAPSDAATEAPAGDVGASQGDGDAAAAPRASAVESPAAESSMGKTSNRGAPLDNDTPGTTTAEYPGGKLLIAAETEAHVHEASQADAPPSATTAEAPGEGVAEVGICRAHTVPGDREESPSAAVECVAETQQATRQAHETMQDTQDTREEVKEVEKMQEGQKAQEERGEQETQEERGMPPHRKGEEHMSCKYTKEELLTRHNGITVDQIKRVKALLKLGVCEEDMAVADRILKLGGWVQGVGGFCREVRGWGRGEICKGSTHI